MPSNLKVLGAKPKVSEGQFLSSDKSLTNADISMWEGLLHDLLTKYKAIRLEQSLDSFKRERGAICAQLTVAALMMSDHFAVGVKTCGVSPSSLDQAALVLKACDDHEIRMAQAATKGLN